MKQETLKTITEALRFYAERESYLSPLNPYSNAAMLSEVEKDLGAKAKEALAAIESEEEAH